MTKNRETHGKTVRVGRSVIDTLVLLPRKFYFSENLLRDYSTGASDWLMCNECAVESVLRCI